MIYYSSNKIDIFYKTGKWVWKERLLFSGEEIHLVKKEEIESIVCNCSTLGVDFSKVTHREFLELQAFGKTILDVNPIVVARRQKTDKEIEALEKSAKLNNEGLLHVQRILSEGVTETELAWEFETYTKKRGATKLAFDPIIAFGEHTASPHHRPTDRRWKRGESVLFDVGVIAYGYASDMTRSLGCNKFSSFVLEAHAIALKMCRPGVSFLEIEKMVQAYFENQQVGKFIQHSLGHGIGLEVHEAPFTKDQENLLQEGMVITIEPGLYEEGVGGYRHEDTIVITKTGYRNFYESRIWAR